MVLRKAVSMFWKSCWQKHRWTFCQRLVRCINLCLNISSFFQSLHCLLPKLTFLSLLRTSCYRWLYQYKKAKKIKSTIESISIETALQMRVQASVWVISCLLSSHHLPILTRFSRVQPWPIFFSHTSCCMHLISPFLDVSYMHYPLRHLWRHTLWSFEIVKRWVCVEGDEHVRVHPPGLRQFFLPTSTSTCVDADVHAPGYLGLCTQGGGEGYIHRHTFVHSLKEEIGVEAQAVQEDAPLSSVFCLTCSSSAAPPVHS